MRNDFLIRALDVCLRQMQSGASLEEAVGLFPQLADELRPLLESAQMAREVGDNVHIPRAAQMRSRAAFLEEAQRRAHPNPGIFSRLFTNKLALASFSLILVLLLGSLTTVAASAQALPGDPLYGVKLATERTRLLLTDNQNKKIKLEQSFDHRRVQEVEALILKSRSQQVNFAGGLTQMKNNTWTVGGINVTLTPKTEKVGDFKLNYYVDVQGNLQPDGTVIASKLEIQTFDISGKIQAITVGQWTINGVTIYITPQTIMNGTPNMGNQAHASTILLSDGHLQANWIEVTGSLHSTTASSPTIVETTPVPSTAPSVPSVVASPTTNPTDTLEPEESPEPTENEGEDATVTPRPTDFHQETQTPEPTEVEHEDITATPIQVNEATSTPRPTESDDGEKWIGSTPTPTVNSPVYTQTREPTDDSEVTNTPDHPSETPVPSPTPEPTREEHD